MPKLHTARFALSAASTHGALYAVGGFNGEQYMSTVEMLDPRVGRYHYSICCTSFLHMLLQRRPCLIKTRLEHQPAELHHLGIRAYVVLAIVVVTDEIDYLGSR